MILKKNKQIKTPLYYSSDSSNVYAPNFTSICDSLKRRICNHMQDLSLFCLGILFSFGNPELFCKQSCDNNSVLRRKLSCFGIIIFSETYVIAYHVPLMLEAKSYKSY